jgi:hypothetical protein
MDGDVMLGVSGMDSTGVAQLTTSSLSAGSHMMRAVYSVNGRIYQSTPQLYVVSALPGSGFSPPISLAAGNGPTGVTSGDFNGDGRTDLAVANYGSGTVSVLQSNGNGTFREP